MGQAGCGSSQREGDRQKERERKRPEIIREITPDYPRRPEVTQDYPTSPEETRDHPRLAVQRQNCSLSTADGWAREGVLLQGWRERDRRAELRRNTADSRFLKASSLQLLRSVRPLVDTFAKVGRGRATSNDGIAGLCDSNCILTPYGRNGTRSELGLAPRPHSRKTCEHEVGGGTPLQVPLGGR